MKKTALVFLIGLLLVACAPRGVLQLVRGVDVGEIREVYVASNRVERYENSVNFSAERGQKLSFARLDVSVPPGHSDGKLELPARGPADPARHFVLSGAYRYPSLDTFIAGLNKAPGGRDEVIVFVHGFNTNFAEAAYRLAQMAHDFEADVPVISFSWPSGGDPRGYAYDRDSVIQSRDALETLLIALARDRKVMIVAHSMGSQLVMEVLRQVSIANRGDALQHVSGVALISPDIDPEVFVTQARRITPFPQPFILMTSTRDKILDFSAWVAGRPRRLGAISSAEGLEGLPVIIVDLTAYSEPDGSGHDTAYTAPRAIELLRSYDPRR